ncbi:MAG: bifunctional hydroxymethylpyrimidine kinase/phosphomethylpyrimidine kinase [Desulfohalobiaceae bacterium]|nr:bifunctional hydroxymethylpyrimidine kinase/phosphomethylpyrimidine kinase [Desulfohalobiaceae bacterium]
MKHNQDDEPMLRNISQDRLLAGIDALRAARITVAGDVMLDHYQYGTVDRISPEAPVPVVAVVQEQYRLGGAANVARNTRSLGAETKLLGCCGNNPARSRIGELLRQEGVEDGILTVPDLATIQKTRVIAQGQQVVRIDKEDSGAGSGAEGLKSSLLRSDSSPPQVLILSDYGKGTLSPGFLAVLQGEEFSGCRIFVDPKPDNFGSYPAPEMITPNRKETERIWGRRMRGPEDIVAAGDAIREGCGAENVLITLGEEGMVLLEASGAVWKIVTQARRVFDVTGAGDTVVAVASAAMAGGMDALHASVLANTAAGMVVEEVGAATVDAAGLKHHIRHGEEISVHKWR